jgi:hypothetical protein
MGVLVFLAVPLAEPPTEPIDRPVSAHRLRDALGDVTSPLAVQGVSSLELPDARDIPPALAAMPGRDGWIPAEKAIAADVVAAVDAALAEIDAQLEQAGREGQPQTPDRPAAASAVDEASDSAKLAIAEAWWSTPSWGGMPLKALHAAKSLGMLAHPGARIESATKAGWKRMQTPAGQVFVAPPASYAGIPLSVVK